jgi:hypothetical protein
MAFVANAIELKGDEAAFSGKKQKDGVREKLIPIFSSLLPLILASKPCQPES